MDDLLVSILFMAVLYFFVLSMAASIHPQAPAAIKRMIKLVLRLTIIWPARALVAGARNFIWPPYDEIHDEPPPRPNTPGSRGERR